MIISWLVPTTCLAFLWGDSLTVIHRPVQGTLLWFVQFVWKTEMWDTEAGKELVTVLAVGTNSTSHHGMGYRVNTAEQATSMEFGDSPSIVMTLCRFLLFSLRHSVFKNWEHINTSLGDKVATEFWTKWTWKCFWLSWQNDVVALENGALCRLALEETKMQK